MKTFRRLIYKEIFYTVSFVALSFIALFFFFDMVDELKNIGKNNSAYEFKHALMFVVLTVPSHLYELMPISVLIGTIFVMARLAQSSEFTILRTSGLGPVMALRNLVSLGMAFTLITISVGDYVSPACDRYAKLIKSHYLKQISVGATGAWLRERQENNNYSVNIGTLTPEGNPADIRIYEFNQNGEWLALTNAKSARVYDDSYWVLSDAERIERAAAASQNGMTLSRVKQDNVVWKTSITSEMVSVALLSPERMRTIDLFSYIRHLNDNGQATQAFEIEFWKKVFYPLSCLVMVVLALPFAYLHFRSGNIAGHVFGGVLAGISFFLLNNVFSYVGNINQWVPWFAAAAPGLLYSLASLASFAWLVARQ
jgi:lipopolysaccharide export system permease protein